MTMAATPIRMMKMRSDRKVTYSRLLMRVLTALLAVVTLASCNVTRRIPDEEVLYTGVKKFDISEIGHERRNGYSWYNDGGLKVLKKYEQWKKKNNR